MLIAAASACAGYLLGSISSAILICRVLGKGDPRTTGSGNPGATNVLRSYGRVPAALTLAGDVAKGWLPVAITKGLGLPPSVVALTALGAFLGHLFPVFFGFRGGKGVATFIGVLFGMSWWLGASFCGIWVAIALLSRYSSLAGLTATALTPVVALFGGLPRAFPLSLAAMAAAIFWRHRANLQRLWAGTESKIGKRAA